LLRLRTFLTDGGAARREENQRNYSKWPPDGLGAGAYGT
jgi:hypothetical protein